MKKFLFVFIALFIAGAVFITCDEEDDGKQSITYYQDSDGDGYGNSSVSVTSDSGAPSGYVSNSGDCNDGDDTINPGADDPCGDGVDDDCNGIIDDKGVYYIDFDQDGYGDPADWNDPEIRCIDGDNTGYSTNTADCDGYDNDDTVYPGEGC